MRPPFFFPLILLVLTLILGTACREAAPKPTPQLQAIVSAQASPFEGVAKQTWADVQKFYNARQQAPAWTDGDGPTEQAAAALDVLRAADAHGLERAAYSEPELTSLHASLTAAAEDTPQ